MRRFLAVWCLPILISLLPFAGSVCIIASLPATARDFYLVRLTRLDTLLIGLGTALFLLQSLLAWKALRWKITSFDETADDWISHLAQAAEWFPLLGLLGTVASILQTFSSIHGPMPAEKIIQLYGPAITATGTGIFMALVNILPAWTVLVGRDFILLLGGISTSKTERPAK